MNRGSAGILSRMNNIINPYRGLPREAYIIAIGRCINGIGMIVTFLLAIILTKKVGLTEAEAGLIISLSGILYIISNIIGGKLTDARGRKKIIIICNTLGAAFYAAAAFMGNSVLIVPSIIISRFIIGIGEPASGAMIADITNPRNRDKAYSLFYFAINIGIAISSAVGGLLLENFLWVMFAVQAAAILITTALIFVFIPETIEKTRERLEKDRKFEESAEGSIIKILLKRPVLILFALIIFGYNFVYSQLYFMFPIHTEKIMPNGGAELFGALMSLSAITVVIFTPFITKLMIKMSSLKKIFCGGILYTIGFSLPGFLNDISIMYVSVFIITLGEITVLPNTMPYIANRTPASHRGRMNAVLPVIMGLGSTLGPLVMGSITSAMGMGISWKIIGAVMVVFVIFAFLLERYDKCSLREGRAAAVN